MGGLVRQLRRPFVLAACTLLLVLLVGLADVVTGAEIHITVFYLAPVALAAWWGSRTSGLLCGAAAAATWLAADRLAGHLHSHALVAAWNTAVLWAFFAATALALGRIRQLLEQEQALSRTDPTTGVANPRAFLETATVEFERARRSRRACSLLFLDCDDFKAVNDTFGHAAGDAVLRRVAETISSSVRVVDVVARLGGDEFAVLLPDTDHAAARALVERLQRALRVAMSRHSFPVTFSLGAVTFPSPVATVEEALRTADELMYDAKRAGKDRARVAIVTPGNEPVPDVRTRPRLVR